MIFSFPAGRQATSGQAARVRLEVRHVGYCSHPRPRDIQIAAVNDKIRNPGRVLTFQFDGTSGNAI